LKILDERLIANSLIEADWDYRAVDEQPFPNPVMERWSTIGSKSIHTEGRTRVETKSSARL